MGFWSWFTGEPAPTSVEAPSPALSTSPKDGPKPGFGFSAEWACGCGNKLKIRSRIERAEGKSNFYEKAPAVLLNWNGLATERGWDTDPVKCPKCKNG